MSRIKYKLIVIVGDSGRPFIHFKSQAQTAKVMGEITNRVIAYIKNHES